VLLVAGGAAEVPDPVAVDPVAVDPVAVDPVAVDPVVAPVPVDAGALGVPPAGGGSPAGVHAPRANTTAAQAATRGREVLMVTFSVR